jgi:hypothetical protein
VAEDFTANFGCAGLIVRQDATRSRQDGNAKPIVNPRQVAKTKINAATRTGYALDFRNHWLTFMIFQLDL